MSREEEMIERCSNIFAKESGPYEYARQLSINNLNVTGELDDETLITFRTILQDLGEFFDDLSNGNCDDAEEILNSIECGLEETACNSAKRTAEHQLKSIEDELLKFPIIYRILFLNTPDNLQQKIGRIEQRIELGESNNSSNWRRVVAYYEEASEIADTIDNGLPTRREVYSQAFAFSFGIITLIGTCIGILSYLGVSWPI